MCSGSYVGQKDAGTDSVDLVQRGHSEKYNSGSHMCFRGGDGAVLRLYPNLNDLELVSREGTTKEAMSQ